MLSAPQSKIINIVLYQLGWFSCVLGGAWGHPFLGSLSALVLMRFTCCWRSGVKLKHCLFCGRACSDW